MSWTLPDAGPAVSFCSALSALCADSYVVTAEPRGASPFDAVVLACDRRALIYELWSDALGIPSGELGVIDLCEIDAVRVSY